MTEDAIYTTVNPILNAHLLIGDFEATPPFCMYKLQPKPLRDKTGVIGYSHILEVSIVDADPDNSATKSEQIKTAIENLTGTIEGTEFEKVIFTDESGFYYSQNDAVYMNDLEFKIFTKIR